MENDKIKTVFRVDENGIREIPRSTFIVKDNMEELKAMGITDPELLKSLYDFELIPINPGDGD